MKQPRLHVRHVRSWSWFFVLAAGLAGCSFQDTGLGTAPAPPPASDPERPPRGGGGTAGTGGRPAPLDSGASTPAPADSGAPPAMVPPMGSPDAASDAGGSGMSLDAGSTPVDAAASPPPTAPPPPTGTKDQCPTGEQALALCLRFEGTTRDESIRALPLMVQRVGFDSGPTGSSLALGETSLVKVDNHQALNGPRFTIEAWVRPSRLPGAGQRMGIVDNEGRYGLFVLPGGTLACHAGSGSVQAAGAVEAGAWTSVGCVSDGNTLSLWVQGTRRAQSGYTPAPAAPASGVTIGSNNPSGDNFVGLVDNVRIWSGPRSQTDLCAAALGCGGG